MSSPKRVLIVDDSADDILQIQRCFKGLGTRIDTAKDGLEALARVSQTQYDVVISDISMPKVNGIEMAAAIKQTASLKAPIIVFVSGVSDSQSRANALRAGGTSVLEKPVDQNLLQAYIDNAQINSANITQLTQALAKAHQYSETDALTGLLNRRGMDLMFGQTLKSAQRLTRPLSLVLLDLDRFKPYNDGYGHVMGDRALAETAHALTKTAKRDVDLVARYGGEEFAVMCTGLNAIQADAFAQKLVASIRKLGIEHVHAPHGRLTISAGVATLDPAYDANRVSLSELIERADTALYDAKALGGDQHACSNEDNRSSVIPMQPGFPLQSEN